MAHNHSHHHHEDDQMTFFLEQIFTIATCGALGGVAVMLWYSSRLYFLADRFHPWVLAGGCTLLFFTLVRAIAVWRSVDAVDALPVSGADAEHVHGEGCSHSHDHGCEHGHEHHHPHDHAHAHDHDHAHAHLTDQPHDHGHEDAPMHSHGYDTGHEHGWAPWRYVVLLLPVLLFFLGLPYRGFSASKGNNINLNEVSAPQDVEATGVLEVGFSDLERMALSPDQRRVAEGKTVTLTGQYVSGGNPRKFTLVRFKLVCCAADAQALNAVIMVNPKSTEQVDPDIYRDKWVEVTGRVHFVEQGGRILTAIILYPSKEQPISELVKIVDSVANPFVN